LCERDEAWYVERATTSAQRTAPLAEVDPASVPYFSLAAGSADDAGIAGDGSVTVVGLGSAGPNG
jgi:precorrin-2 C20-methyltransferase/precorrin-3B C17-methyltransferase